MLQALSEKMLIATVQKIGRFCFYLFGMHVVRTGVDEHIVFRYTLYGTRAAILAGSCCGEAEAVTMGK